jgi:hypothetical protein
MADGGILPVGVGRRNPQSNDEHEELTVRTDPDATTTSERDALGQYLDYQRETILLKTEGLSKEQLGQPIPTSGLTLAGLLYHLAFVEEDWFEVDFLGLPKREEWQIDWAAEPDYEFRVAREPPDHRRRARPRPTLGLHGGRRQALHSPLDAAAPDRGDRAPRGSRRPAARGY